MTAEEHIAPESMPRWTRMPGSMRLKLERAVFQHLLTHGPLYYDLLKDDPQFAPWIGTHLGARGEKRLDRVISDLRRNQPAKARRNVVPMSGGRIFPIKREPPAPLPARVDELPARVLDGGVGVISYEELQASMRRQRVEIEHAINGCKNEDEELAKPELLVRLSRELRAIIRDSEVLTRRFHANINSEGFTRLLLRRLSQEHTDEPEKGRSLFNDISQLVRECGGLAATGTGQ